MNYADMLALRDAALKLSHAVQYQAQVSVSLQDINQGVLEGAITEMTDALSRVGSGVTEDFISQLAAAGGATLVGAVAPGAPHVTVQEALDTLFGSHAQLDTQLVALRRVVEDLSLKVMALESRAVVVRSVTEWGVVFDDVTKAEDNIIALNTAITEAQAGRFHLTYPGGKLYIRRKAGATLPIEQYIHMRRGVNHYGAGIDATEIVRQGPHSLFWAGAGVDGSNVTISNMTLNGNPGIVGHTYFAANLTYMEDSDGIVFDRVRFLDAPGLHAMDINGCDGVLALRCEFLGCEATLSESFGGATYYPESMQVGKSPDQKRPSRNIRAIDCKWGPSAKYGAPFVAIGNHSSGGDTDINAYNVVVEGGSAEGLLRYFARPFAYDGMHVRGVATKNMPGRFMHICGSRIGDVTTPSRDISIDGVNWDGAGSFVTTDNGLIVAPNTARYSKIRISNCDVKGRSSVNGLDLRFCDDVLLENYTCAGARAALYGQALTNLRIMGPQWHDLMANGIEIGNVVDYPLLSRDFLIQGGRINDVQFYSLLLASVKGCRVLGVDLTGSSMQAPTRGAIQLNTNCEDFHAEGCYSRPSSNPNQPAYFCTATSGVNHTFGLNRVTYTGPQGVITPATGRTYVTRARVYKTAQPTSGFWQAGDEVMSLTFTVGTPRGWLCIESGTPGVWRAMANH